MSNEKHYMDMSDEGLNVSKEVYKKYLKLFEGAAIRPLELYWRFRDEYIKDLVVSFSRDYKGVTRERIKAIVYESYLDKTYIKQVLLDVISAHNEALNKVLENYQSLYFSIDLFKIVKILEKETGQKPTDEDISRHEEAVIDAVNRNPMAIIERYPELYMVYYKEMYNKLRDYLNDIAVRAETKLKYENARSFLRKYLTEQEIKLLDESPYHAFKIAEAIKKGKLDEVRSMLQELIKSQEHIEPTKEGKISFYKKLLDLVIYLKKRLGDEQAPEL